MKMLSGIFFGLFLASSATAYNPDLIESAPYTVVEGNIYGSIYCQGF